MFTLHRYSFIALQRWHDSRWFTFFEDEIFSVDTRSNSATDLQEKCNWEHDPIHYRHRSKVVLVRCNWGLKMEHFGKDNLHSYLSYLFFFPWRQGKRGILSIRDINGNTITGQGESIYSGDSNTMDFSSSSRVYLAGFSPGFMVWLASFRFLTYFWPMLQILFLVFNHA